jgi:sortase A
MRVVFRKTSLRAVLQWTQRVLFAGGILLLGYCGFVLADAWMFQHRERQRLEQLLHDQRQAKASSATSPPAIETLPLIGPDGLIGRIEILRLGVAVVVVEGTDKSTLRRAAGHIVGTGLPGQAGNIGIAAHRDTFFRPLRNILRDDIITLTTLRGEYRYRVVSIKVVSPYDVAVLNPDGNEILTLVTCYPFYFVGAAPDRFIVRAERVTDKLGAAAKAAFGHTYRDLHTQEVRSRTDKSAP